jgi:hypothetical protein
MLAAEVQRLAAGEPLLNVANRADLPVHAVSGAT